eukprot:COSAG06_NODE_4960_length_3831_cov_5.211683_3_plen_204_part_00
MAFPARGRSLRALSDSSAGVSHFPRRAAAALSARSEAKRSHLQRPEPLPACYSCKALPARAPARPCPTRSARRLDAHRPKALGSAGGINPTHPRPFLPSTKPPRPSKMRVPPHRAEVRQRAGRGFGVLTGGLVVMGPCVRSGCVSVGRTTSTSSAAPKKWSTRCVRVSAVLVRVSGACVFNTCVWCCGTTHTWYSDSINVLWM